MRRWPRSVSPRSAPISPIRSRAERPERRSVAEVADDRNDEQRRDDEDRRGEAEVEREDVDEDEDHRQHSLHEVGEARAERRLDLLGVREQPAHQLARGALRGEARGLVEERPVRVAAQVAHHREADRVQRELREVGEDVLDEQRGDQQERDRAARAEPDGPRRVPHGRVAALEAREQGREPARGRRRHSGERGRRAGAERPRRSPSSGEREAPPWRRRRAPSPASASSGPGRVAAEVAKQARQGSHEAVPAAGATARRPASSSADRT